MVVDDSITMRALFSDVLERTEGISVIGAAANADEARDMIKDLKPDVLTLDVEMPGKSGLEFLEELMETSPMPVVMLSTLTQKGAQTSFKALELGAVDCFPKPQQATPAEFDKIVDKLGKLVIAAAGGKVKTKAAKAAAPAAALSERAFEWNGKLVAMSASTGGVEAAGFEAAGHRRVDQDVRRHVIGDGDTPARARVLQRGFVELRTRDAELCVGECRVARGVEAAADGLVKID